MAPRVCLADDFPDAEDAAGPGDQALRISGSDFLPANHHTAVTSQLKSFYGFLLSTGQSPDFLARHSSLLCSDLELFFSRSTRQDSADSSALYCRMLTCLHVANRSFAFREGQEEDGRRERSHHLFPWAPCFWYFTMVSSLRSIQTGLFPSVTVLTEFWPFSLLLVLSSQWIIMT